MTTAKKLMTASELLALPDDGKRYELIRGVLITMAPASDPHGGVTDRIGRRIGNFVEAHNLGRTRAAETGFSSSMTPIRYALPITLSFLMGVSPGCLPARRLLRNNP